MSQKEGKWAAEAFGFLRLFRRVEQSVSGLVLLELGWGLAFYGLALLGLAAAPIEILWPIEPAARRFVTVQLPPANAAHTDPAASRRQNAPPRD